MIPQLREMTDADRSFIISSWLKSYRNADSVTHLSNDVYYTGHAKLINDLLATSNVTIACDPSYPTSMFGYIVHDANVAHYLYVKYSLRRHGVATMLYEAAGKPSVATHFTFVVPKLPFKFVHNPYGVYP